VNCNRCESWLWDRQLLCRSGDGGVMTWWLEFVQLMTPSEINIGRRRLMLLYAVLISWSYKNCRHLWRRTVESVWYWVKSFGQRQKSWLGVHSLLLRNVYTVVSIVKMLLYKKWGLNQYMCTVSCVFTLNVMCAGAVQNWSAGDEDRQ